MRITKKELIEEVNDFNKKHCKNSKNEFCVLGAYGGYKVGLTGKKRKDGRGQRGIGGAVADVTYGYLPAKETIADLHKADAKGRLKDAVNRYEKSTSVAKKSTTKKKR